MWSVTRRGLHLQTISNSNSFTRRSLHTTSRFNQHQQVQSTSRPVEGSTDISHSSFISSASPSSDFNPLQTPQAGRETASPWQGYLSPTNSHLLKLILPLPSSKSNFKWNVNPEKSGTQPQPTAFLLHPSQPLSHLSRLIAGSLPVKFRDCELEYLALTGQEEDLDSHLRNAEEERRATEGQSQLQSRSQKPNRQEGGPHLGERSKSKGRYQQVSWSQSTDLADFVKQSCLNESFKIVITPRTIAGEEVKSVQEGGEKMGMELEVIIPSFASRTTYLRRRLLELTKALGEMTDKKKSIDTTAHKGAQKLFVAGLSVGAAYWIAVIRWTFFTDAGWDIMEPVTWATGFGALLASCSFLVYHNREVSYSSLLDLSISARQQRLYQQHGLDIEKWTESVAEAKTLRKEIERIAADYDIKWKGDLEDLADEQESDDSVGKESVSRFEERWSKSDVERKSDKSHRNGNGSGSGSGNGNEGKNGNGNNDQHVHDQSIETKDGKKQKHLDIDKTIDEASKLAEESETQRNKEKAAQRKGESVENEEDGRGVGGRERMKREKEGRERAEQVVERNREL